MYVTLLLLIGTWKKSLPYVLHMSYFLPQVFAPFALVNALHVSEYIKPLWSAAKEEYERRMQPIEERLSQKLKELFGSVLIPSFTAAVSKHGERGGTVAQPHQVRNNRVSSTKAMILMHYWS